MDSLTQLRLVAGLLSLALALICGVLLVSGEEPFARLCLPRWARVSLLLVMIGTMLLAVALLRR